MEVKKEVSIWMQSIGHYRGFIITVISVGVKSRSHISSRWLQCTLLDVCTFAIQVQKSKNYFNMEALSIGCWNKHWPQYFNRIFISSTGYLTICPAIVVQAALESRAACTTIAWKMWDNQLMNSKFDENILISAYFCSLCWVPPY